MNWPDNEADPPRWEAGDRPPQPCDSLLWSRVGETKVRKAFPAHTIKAHRGSRGIESISLNNGTNLTRGYVEHRVSEGDLEKREFCAPARNRILDRPTCSLVTILTELPRLPFERVREREMLILYIYGIPGKGKHM